MGGVLMAGSGEIVVARPIRKREPGERSMMARALDRIRGWAMAGASVAGPMLAPYGWTDPRWWSENPEDAPPPATEASVLGLPAFGRGVDLIASAGAGVDLIAYRYDKTDQIEVKLDPQPELLRDPDPITTPWNWRYAVFNDLILYGNSFAFLGNPNADGWPRWLNPVDPARVELGEDQETGALVWRVAGQLVPFGELWHASAGNLSGRVLGRGAIRQYQDSLTGLLSTERHTRRYFSKGGMPSAVIQSSDKEFGQTQANEVKEKYRQTIGGGSREPLVLPANLTFTPVVSDAEKQQLVEARKWDAQLAGMVLGIQPYQLGLPGTSMTYQNIEQADIAFVRDTVNRWADPFAHAVTKWLLPSGQTASFDWMRRMRMDAKTRAEVLSTEISSKLASVDEARRMMNRRPLPEQAPQPAIGGSDGDDEVAETPAGSDEPTPEKAA